MTAIIIGEDTLKAFLSAALVAASLVAAPMPVFASVDVAVICDDSSPEGWRRPGGYCDAATGSGSISEPSSEGCKPGQLAYNLSPGERVRVADQAYDSCGNPLHAG